MSKGWYCSAAIVLVVFSTWCFLLEIRYWRRRYLELFAATRDHLKSAHALDGELARADEYLREHGL